MTTTEVWLILTQADPSANQSGRLVCVMCISMLYLYVLVSRCAMYVYVPDLRATDNRSFATLNFCDWLFRSQYFNVTKRLSIYLTKKVTLAPKVCYTYSY